MKSWVVNYLIREFSTKGRVVSESTRRFGEVYDQSYVSELELTPNQSVTVLTLGQTDVLKHMSLSTQVAGLRVTLGKSDNTTAVIRCNDLLCLDDETVKTVSLQNTSTANLNVKIQAYYTKG